MSMNFRKTETTVAEARKSTLLVAAAFVVVGLFLWYRGRTTIPAAAGVAAALLIIAVLVPPLAMLFHRGWMKFAHILGYVNSRILLSIVYFLIFVPYGIISRLFGRDPLDMRGEPRSTYWHKRTKTRQTKEGFERLF